MTALHACLSCLLDFPTTAVRPTYIFCRDKTFVLTNICHGKHNFVATSLFLSRLLSRQTFVTTKILCHNKHNFAATKLLSRQKWYLWQPSPMLLLQSRAESGSHRSLDDKDTLPRAHTGHLAGANCMSGAADLHTPCRPGRSSRRSPRRPWPWGCRGCRKWRSHRPPVRIRDGRRCSHTWGTCTGAPRPSWSSPGPSANTRSLRTSP